MQRVELVLGLVVLALWIYSLVSCILTPDSQVRGIPKALWLVVIVLLPLLGSVLWLGVGRERGATRAPRVQPTGGYAAAPGSSGYSSLSAEERIRRMEEDLRRLDEEAGPGEDPARPDRG